MARDAQAVVDFVGFVEVRIVDEAFPSDGGAGLLKVDTHDDAQVGGELGDCAFKEACVFAGGLGIVDGAGAGEDEEAVVFFVENRNNLVAAVEDGGRCSFSDRKLLLKKNGRENDFGPLNAEILSGMEHRLVWGSFEARRSAAL